jgi:hypothetical protein
MAASEFARNTECWNFTSRPWRMTLDTRTASGLAAMHNEEFVRVYAERGFGIPPEQVVGSVGGTGTR